MDRYQLRGGPKGSDRVGRGAPGRGRRRRAGSKAVRLLSAGIAAAVAGTACGDGAPRSDGADVGGEPAPFDPGPDLDTIRVEAEFLPQWESAPAPPPALDDAVAFGDAGTVAIYLDVSSPMGGFVPVDGAPPREGTGANPFRTVVQWVPDHLTRAYPSATLEWRAVGEDVRPISGIPRMERSDFAARASRIDLAIRGALADLQSGRSEAAALVTDLLGTGENLAPGPLALLQHLRPWLESTLVRSGELHLGILGAKAAYWGVASRGCPLRAGMGCWYSERGGEWRRMEEVAPAPFYVLLMGRDADAINTVLGSIQGDAEGQDIEVLAELLTSASLPRQTAGTCLAFAREDNQRTRQYSLRVRDYGEYACVRDEPSTLACRFDQGMRPTDARIVDPSDGFAVAGGDGSDDEFEIGVRCDALPRPEPDLVVDVEGTFAGDAQRPPWDEWSIETDDLFSFPGKTLQLRYFVQDARLAPDFHRADSVLILRARRP